MILTELFLNLLDNPRCYAKLVAEVVAAEKNGNLSSPVATYEECKGLPYFMATVSEILRGGFATTSLIPRVVPAGGKEVLNTYLPEGTAIASIPWIVLRNKSLFGEDADMFRPERWVEAEPAKLQKWRRCDFMWGYGARSCAGRELATMALVKPALHVGSEQFLRVFRPS